MRRESSNEVLAFLLLGLTAFLAVCLYSWSPGDLLADHPAGESTANICGPVGADLSSWAMSWIGKTGSYACTTVLAVMGICMFFRLPIRQPGWKVFGAIGIILSLATFEVAVCRNTGNPGYLAGGYFGYRIYDILFEGLHVVGTCLLLSIITVVSFVVSTDTELYPAFAYANRVVKRSKPWRQALGSTGGRLTGVIKSGVLSLFHSAARLKKTSEPRRKIHSAGQKHRQKIFRPDEEPEKEPEEKPAEEPEVAVKKEETAERPPLLIHLPEAPRKSKKPKARKKKDTGPYEMPPITLLEEPRISTNHTDKKELERKADKIEAALESFKIEGARVVEIQQGPTVTLFELILKTGQKVSQVSNLDLDLQRELEAESIRIIAPIPGKNTVGIEVANGNPAEVGLREILEVAMEENSERKVPVCIGKDTTGTPVIDDLTRMPHCLIAGQTGSGKSVFINSFLINLLLTKTPTELKLILVDPKIVELKPYAEIPHLLCPIVTGANKVTPVLQWLVDEMQTRYRLLAAVKVRNIGEYNELEKKDRFELLREKHSNEEAEIAAQKLPYIVLVIDELADLMMESTREVEGHITRLTQKSRAVGIHLIVATQRPSVDVITGLIKSNMPSRISFKVSQKNDSRTILDENGADKLVGNGDMLYKSLGASKLCRTQGAFLSDKEIQRVIDHVVQQGKAEFNEALTKCSIDGVPDAQAGDKLYETAVERVLTQQRGSTTFLQRALGIGYTRASRLIEAMEKQGLVGPHVGSKQRDVYYTFEQYQDLVNQALEDKQESDGDDPEINEPPAEDHDDGGDDGQNSEDSGSITDDEQ